MRQWRRSADPPVDEQRHPHGGAVLTQDAQQIRPRGHPVESRVQRCPDRGDVGGGGEPDRPARVRDVHPHPEQLFA